MDVKAVLKFSEAVIRQAPREELVEMVCVLRAEVTRSAAELGATQQALSEKTAALSKHMNTSINIAANQPSSKQPEFNKDTGAGTNNASSEKKTQKKKRKGRKGAGNKSKPLPDSTHINPLTQCPECQSDLTAQPVAEEVRRIVEDIVTIPEKTTVSEEIQERKWCPTCRKIVASSSEAALPKSDIGLRATCLISYLWVVSAISMPGIVAFAQSFFRFTVSTAGVSSMMIRLAKILKPVSLEILSDVKDGVVIFADETGWRVKGVLWWLWAFSNPSSAYYFPSPSRGSAVVEQILGTIFAGVLVSDAWCAYRKITCAKQTCMAHILRKIRKFREAYPQYASLLLFHQRLKRLLRDGERLQGERKELGEAVFVRRLGHLKDRLAQLVQWKDPDEVLKVVIAKVVRQQAYILTFVEHDGVPNHNNYAEYIIKKGVLKRKVSGGSMSSEGLEAYAIIQSVAQTCYLRNISFAAYLGATCIHYIRTGTPLSLKEYAVMTSKETQIAANASHTDKVAA